MSCENALWGNVHPLVPVYDAVVFCNTGAEPPWVLRQARFVEDACKAAGIPYYELQTHLYERFAERFGVVSMSSSIPWWTLAESGKVGRLYRECNYDYKVKEIYKLARKLLGYGKGEWTCDYDLDRHEMHLGFGAEELKRRFKSQNPLFKNRYPLIEMGWTRRDCYAYNLKTWGLEIRASSCVFCPFHRNCFYLYLRKRDPENYDLVLDADRILEERMPGTVLRSQLFVAHSCKRIRDLTPADCQDARYFEHDGKWIWDGF